MFCQGLALEFRLTHLLLFLQTGLTLGFGAFFGGAADEFGLPGGGRFLLALQTYKSLGDVAGGSAMFEKYSAVDDAMVGVRGVVMARKEPRKLLVQPHLHQLGTSSIGLATFPATPTGMIESFVARFPAEDAELLKLAEADMPHVLD